MPISTQEFIEISNPSTYARYIHTNLHIHTPATKWDWDAYEGQTRTAEGLTIDDFFKALNSTSLDLVSITDHNCIDWCSPLIDMARKGRKDGSSKLHILPGVEITTYEGPHLIAIFDEEKNPEEIRRLLTRLGMSGKGEQEDKVGRTGKTYTIQEVMNEIIKENGIVVGPHIDSKDGIWGFKNFRSRNEVLNSEKLKILAAKSGEIKRVCEKEDKVRLLCRTMDSNVYTNSYGFINTSDCHRLEDFEINTTWIKMGKIGLEGVRQIIYEPELRTAHEIRNTEKEVENPEILHFATPNEVTHPYIIGLAVSGGMLNGMKVRFSPNLNNIIGKNYAGKSAILDCIRFGLDSLPIDDLAHDKMANRLKTFVGEGGEVRLYLSVNGDIYGISRNLVISKTGRGANAKSVIEGRAEVFHLWNDVDFQHETGVEVKAKFPVEVYPQGEVVKIKDNVSQQMNIVDSLSQVEKDILELNNEIINGSVTPLGYLVQNRGEIINKIQKKAELAEAIADIEKLKDEIKELEALSNSDKYKEKKLWASQEVKIDTIVKDIKAMINGWGKYELLPLGGEEEKKKTLETAKIGATGEDKEINLEKACPAEYEQYAMGLYYLAVTKASESSDSIRNLLNRIIAKLNALEESRQKHEHNLDEEIRKSVKAEETGTKGDVLIGYLTKRQKELNEMEGKQRELTQISEELKRLFVARKQYLTAFKAKWNAIQTARKDVVAMINRGSASCIKADIQLGCVREEYRKKLEHLVDKHSNATNKISRKELQIAEIVEHTEPEKLIEIIRSNDPDELVKLCPEVTDHTARFITMFSEEDLLELEECLSEDRFVISYKREGEEGFTPIESGLSGGEQALALISVAMVPKPVPLIIDQPEDELGPALITHELVEQIRDVKDKRQLIFVTHVPNIPVLADSEQIIYVKQYVNDGIKESKQESCGSLDNLEIVGRLLELDGGDKAFEKRSLRYAMVMNK